MFLPFDKRILWFLFGGNKYICKGEFTKMEIIVLRKHRLVSMLKSLHLKKRKKQRSSS